MKVCGLGMPLFFEYWLKFSFYLFYLKEADEHINFLILLFHSNCLQYSHLPLLQRDLKTEQTVWNTHDIRKQRNAPGPFGKPDLLFTSPPPGMSFESLWGFIFLFVF